MASERVKTGLTVGASIATGLILASIILPHTYSHGEREPEYITVAPQDHIDRPDFEVKTANLSPELVFMGTTHPYPGNGPPGVLLRIVGIPTSSTYEWTLNAWANETTPSDLDACQRPTIYFDHYDWLFQADDFNGGYGQWASKASSIVERGKFDGDQCLSRVGILRMELTVCIEGIGPDDTDGEGPPRGIYDTPDGYRHKDTWDRCERKDVILPSAMV